MNHGARNSTERKYCAEEMAICADAHYLSDTEKEMLARKVHEAEEWLADRGTSGDNVDVAAVHRLADAIDRRDTQAIAHASADVLDGKMHPTARDIVGGAARQCVYTVCGRKAYTFEE